MTIDELAQETRWSWRWNDRRARWERWWNEIRRSDGSLIPAKKFSLGENLISARFSVPLFVLLFLALVTAAPVWYYRLQGGFTWNQLWLIFGALCAWRFVAPAFVASIRTPPSGPPHRSTSKA